jgi:hypothetical protein
MMMKSDGNDGKNTWFKNGFLWLDTKALELFNNTYDLVKLWSWIIFVAPCFKVQLFLVREMHME